MLFGTGWIPTPSSTTGSVAAIKTNRDGVILDSIHLLSSDRCFADGQVTFDNKSINMSDCQAAIVGLNETEEDPEKSRLLIHPNHVTGARVIIDPPETLLRTTHTKL
jgi:hypothetical protein